MYATIGHIQSCEMRGRGIFEVLGKDEKTHPWVDSVSVIPCVTLKKQAKCVHRAEPAYNDNCKLQVFNFEPCLTHKFAPLAEMLAPLNVHPGLKVLHVQTLLPTRISVLPKDDKLSSTDDEHPSNGSN
ncbi:hypothetical protein HBI07_078070 [Parastagonospora nodorum]|nr:hypothetical protein HBI07_078070 [Parastagonospora nodorum]